MAGMHQPDPPQQAGSGIIEQGHRNRLASEKSPYLSQHATNPVDWYPWGDEAFRKAKAEDKPVFLSIGYSTCHWCHVMAHESFENPEVARLLNEFFICIKVDREERPDIDAVYMTVCRMITGSGGWPLSLFLSPEKKPFFAATYIPRESRFGAIGMLVLLPRIAMLWKERKQDLLASADQVNSALGDFIRQDEPYSAHEGDLLTAAYEKLVLTFDAEYGGFGGAPKFPVPHILMFLMRYWKRTGEIHALEMVTKTLEGICMGGITDQIGGGIHRYATDAKWRVPHFEKMLYDQALYAIARIEAFQVTGKSIHRETAEETLGYVLRDMVSPQGSFFSAEDADTSGIEGAYYLWTAAEMSRVLGREDAAIAQAVFNVTESGNFSGPEGTGGGNILYRTTPMDVIAQRFTMSEEELASRIETIRNTLSAARNLRPRPARDEKVLADGNGLMIAALAKAAQAFNDPSFAMAAGRAADFILSDMRMPDRGLYHVYYSGQPAIRGFADDYAGMVFGLTELYEATFEKRYLADALDLTDYLLAHFEDAEKGGFFTTPDNGEELLIRIREVYDGATPSCNSLTFYNLLRLFHLTGIEAYELAAGRLSEICSGTVGRAPEAHSFYLCALNYATGSHIEVVIAGTISDPGSQRMIRTCRAGFRPSLVVRFEEEPVTTEPQSPKSHSAERYPVLEGRATAYVCSRKACSAPVTDPETLEGLLDQKMTSSSSLPAN